MTIKEKILEYIKGNDFCCLLCLKEELQNPNISKYLQKMRESGFSFYNEKRKTRLMHNKIMYCKKHNKKTKHIKYEGD